MNQAMVESASSPAKFRVAIVGAGPGGLALAVAISKFCDPHRPVVVDLYESQPQIGTVGAGISVWPRTRTVLDQFGLMHYFKDELNAQGGEGKGFLHRKSDEETGYHIFQITNLPYDPMLLHRSDFIHALQNEIPPPPLCTIYTNKRLEYLATNTAGDTVTLKFTDGSEADADAVVGADGIRSLVRSNMLSRDEHVEPEWTGVIAYRTLVSKQMLEAKGLSDHPARKDPIIYCGKGRHLVLYPISRGDCINTVAFVTVEGHSKRFDGKWVRDTSAEEVRKAFNGFEPEVQNYLQCIPEKVSAWAIHIVPHVPRCSSGRIAILGDAMHASETHFGAGAGQAIEDGYVLARLLTHSSTTHSTIPQAFQAYNQSRLDFAADIVDQAHHLGKLYEFLEGPKPSETGDAEWLDEWRKEVYNLWEFQMHDNGAQEFWEAAERHLSANLDESSVTFQ